MSRYLQYASKRIYTDDLILIQTFENSIENTLVIRWTVFIGPKDFDGRETLDLILSSQALVLISIYCCDLHNTLYKTKNHLNQVNQQTCSNICLHR